MEGPFGFFFGIIPEMIRAGIQYILSLPTALVKRVTGGVSAAITKRIYKEDVYSPAQPAQPTAPSATATSQAQATTTTKNTTTTTQTATSNSNPTTTSPRR